MEKKSGKKKSSTKATKTIKAEKEVEVVEEVKSEKEVVKTSAENDKKTSHFLFKTLAISIFVAIILSWIIPAGTFNGANLTTTEPARTGINEMFLSMFYASNYYLLQVIFVLVVGLFYGVLSRTNGYKKLVNKASEFWQPRKKYFALVHTVIIALFVSMATQSFPILLFIPLIISIASRLGYDKLKSVMITFGAMIVGFIGQTTSTLGLDYLEQTMSVNITTNLLVRYGILAIALLLLNMVLIKMKTKKNNDKNLAAEQLDLVSLTGNENDGKAWPYVVIFAVLFVFCILGYMPWDSAFGINAFDAFHTWLTTKVTVTIGGNSHAIFGYILGNINAFGKWDIYTICYIAMIILIFVKLFTKIKMNELLEAAVEGIKKTLKPALFVVLAYTMFVICYWSGFTNIIVDKIVGTTFNPISATVANALASFFHVDFGFSGFTLGATYAARFADYTGTMLVIMTSINGLVSLVAPTSVLLVTGLSMYDVSYKEWLKNIWKFAVILLVLLLILFSVMAYV